MSETAVSDEIISLYPEDVRNVILTLYKNEKLISDGFGHYTGAYMEDSYHPDAELIELAYKLKEAARLDLRI